MDRDATADDLREYLPPSAREALRVELDLAYRDAGSRFDASVGSDAQWFGFTVWKFAENRLRRIIEKGKHALRDATAGGQFRIGFGHFVMVTYSCGHSAPDDPSKEFPNNDSGAGFLTEINTGQYPLKIDGFGERPGVAIVLAHYGNHENGLEALYLKRPSAQIAGKITEWGYIEEIWRIGGSATGGTPTPTPSGPVLPGPAKIDKPALPFRKPIKKSDTESA